MKDEVARMRAWGRKRTRVITRTRRLGHRRTSDEISTIAARLLSIDLSDILAGPDEVLADVKRVAASALSQDEHKGRRR